MDEYCINYESLEENKSRNTRMKRWSKWSPPFSYCSKICLVFLIRFFSLWVWVKIQANIISMCSIPRQNSNGPPLTKHIGKCQGSTGLPKREGYRWWGIHTIGICLHVVCILYLLAYLPNNVYGQWVKSTLHRVGKVNLYTKLLPTYII